MLKEGNYQFSYSPARRLVWWYDQLGRKDDAKKLLLRAATTERTNPGYSGGYWQYRIVQSKLSVAGELLRSGDTIDAVRIYNALLADKDTLDQANQNYGGGRGFDQQIEQGLKDAMKALKPGIKVWGAEPETAAPAARSFAMGGPQVFKEWQASFVDGAGGQSVFPRMWQRMRPVVDGCIVVSLEETKRAMRLMAEKARIVSEGAGALPLAAALTGKAGPGPIVAIVSGGNIDLKKFAELIGSAAETRS